MFSPARDVLSQSKGNDYVARVSLNPRSLCRYFLHARDSEEGTSYVAIESSCFRTIGSVLAKTFLPTQLFRVKDHMRLKLAMALVPVVLAATFGSVRAAVVTIDAVVDMSPQQEMVSGQYTLSAPISIANGDRVSLTVDFLGAERVLVPALYSWYASRKSRGNSGPS